MVKIGSRLALDLLSAAAGALACAPLGAATTSGTMAVSLTVEEACHLDVRPLRFETLRTGTTGADADSSLAVACSRGAEFLVSLDDGQHRAGGGRRMATAGGNFLAYELYSDAARTRRWGAGPAESVAAQMAGARAVTLPIYGRVLAAAADAGDYSDVVTVTVSF